MITHNVGNLVLAYLLEIDRMQELGQKLTHQTEERRNAELEQSLATDDRIQQEETQAHTH